MQKICDNCGSSFITHIAAKGRRSARHSGRKVSGMKPADDELDDGTQDRIWDEAWIDAINGSKREDRYHAGTPEREFYDFAYRQHYAKEWH